MSEADPEGAGMDHDVFRFGGGFAERVVERAEGACVFRAGARAVPDFTSGPMSAILGYADILMRGP